MKTFLYIIFSKKLNRFYTGITTLEVQERLENHVEKKYGKLNFTQKATDWELYFFILCENLSQARKIEIHIKRMKSRKYIENLKVYHEMTVKLLDRYKSTDGYK